MALHPNWGIERDEAGQPVRMVLCGYIDRPSRGVGRSTGQAPCPVGERQQRSVERASKTGQQIDWIEESYS